jgi:hypothetical protein
MIETRVDEAERDDFEIPQIGEVAMAGFARAEAVASPKA